MTDLAASLLAPRLAQALQRRAPNLGLEITPYDRAYDDLATGKMDLLFSLVELPPPFRTHYLYADTFTCVISERNGLKHRPSLSTST